MLLRTAANPLTSAELYPLSKIESPAHGGSLDEFQLNNCIYLAKILLSFSFLAFLLRCQPATEHYQAAPPGESSPGTADGLSGPWESAAGPRGREGCGTGGVPRGVAGAGAGGRYPAPCRVPRTPRLKQKRRGGGTRGWGGIPRRPKERQQPGKKAPRGREQGRHR